MLGVHFPGHEEDATVFGGDGKICAQAFDPGGCDAKSFFFYVGIVIEDGFRAEGESRGVGGGDGGGCGGGSDGSRHIFWEG